MIGKKELTKFIRLCHALVLKKYFNPSPSAPTTRLMQHLYEFIIGLTSGVSHHIDTDSQSLTEGYRFGAYLVRSLIRLRTETTTHLGVSISGICDIRGRYTCNRHNWAELRREGPRPKCPPAAARTAKPADRPQWCTKSHFPRSLRLAFRRSNFTFEWQVVLWNI